MTFDDGMDRNPTDTRRTEIEAAAIAAAQAFDRRLFLDEAAMRAMQGMLAGNHEIGASNIVDLSWQYAEALWNARPAS
jgi:hypothetical protein